MRWRSTARLGDAWLGRGLCLIRQGKDEDGRRDLQVAAALEPNRAFFHSYLGKAFSNDGNEPKARLELERAKTLDPKDPTPWIYSAIENKQDSRINEAVRDLEKSMELNDNRRVYRSQFLLDQDRAVRSANLAAIYQADGMEDVSRARSHPRRGLGLRDGLVAFVPGQQLQRIARSEADQSSLRDALV